MKNWNVFCSVLAICIAIQEAVALPPLGLTQISPSPVSLSNLEVLDQTAYLGVPGGIWTVDSAGVKTFLPISHPVLGAPYSVTRAVAAFDGDLYVAANFGSASDVSGAALYNLEQLSNPIVTWESSRLVGVDANLRGLGNQDEATRFLLNGTTELLAYPADAEPGYFGTSVASSTPMGYAIGNAVVPMTIGDSPALWAPEGNFSFVFGFGFATSIRDRRDGHGINIGANLSAATVRLGDVGFEIQDQNGGFLDIGGNNVVVSHSDFVVFDANPFLSVAEFYAFYPGIAPSHPSRGRPLLDIFPELALVDIDAFTDLASVDGYLYMTLSGDDGLYLFGARDPSVVPEPTSIALAILGFTAILMNCRRS